MKKNTLAWNRYYRLVAKIILFFFTFSTCHFWVPEFRSSAQAAPGEITYFSRYAYDPNGNVNSYTTPNGDTILFEYDSLNRLIKKTYPDLSEVGYTYDSNGNRLTMSDGSGTTQYAYDRFNRLAAVQFQGINPIYYQYNKANRLKEMTYPTGEKITYAYDPDNRLVGVTDVTGTVGYDYDNLTNNLIKTTLPNGVTTEYTYDTAKRITDVVTRRSDTTLISSFYYNYDANNNCTRVVETSASGTRTIDYSYDKLNRMLSAVCSDGTFERYTYDSSGNRLSKVTHEKTINYKYDQDNRLLSAGNTYFFYDPSGNLIRKMSPEKSIDYTYDFENRLIEYWDGVNTIGFEYDGDGNRISKSVNGQTIKYINNLAAEHVQVLIEATPENTVIRRCAYGHSRLNQIHQARASYYLYDAPARSVTGLVNDSQSVMNQYNYDAFGNILNQTQAVSNPYRYNGEQFDKETGLIFLRHRYYDPEIGRFLSKDPFPGHVEAPQTENPYPYVQNNPVNGIDPSGAHAVWDAAKNFFLLHAPSAVRLVKWIWDNKIALPWIASQINTTVWGFLNNVNQCAGILMHNLTHPDEFVYNNIVYPLDDYVFPWIGRQGSRWGDEVNNSPFSYARRQKTRERDARERERSLKWVAPPKPLDDIMFEKNNDQWYNYRLKRGIKKFSYRTGGYRKVYSYGGVSLSKTASLMVDINDIAGATFDEGTGQVILFGKQDLSLPQMELDELAVAVRSVYGYGGLNPQDPGVSIGTEPSEIPGQMKVRYDGQTRDTNFGWTMFESDRVLKILTLGIDNLTGNPVSSSVPGYMSMLARYAAAGGVPGGSSRDRMWFVPQEVSLLQSNDDSSMVFNTVAMELLTESKFNGGVVENPVAEEFATHFTQHYDDFAADSEHPILRELKRIGKITAVVKWIRDNNIPFDLSFFENYMPAHYETPDYTPQVSNSTGIPGGTLTITGGVQYRLDPDNFSSTPDPLADTHKQAAVNARPAETDFSWNFSDAAENFKAVAHSMTRAKKDGNIQKSETDMSFPVQGDNPLSLVRHYNSFYDKASGFGRGWDILPYKLRFPADKRLFNFGGQTLTVEAFYQIFLTENGAENLYTLFGLSYDNLPLYAWEGGQDVVRDNLDGTFTQFRKNGGSRSFDSQGRLTRMTDLNGLYIDYNYTGADLTSITHSGGSGITLNYTGDRISSAVGPGMKTMSYTYDINGNLESVTNEENQTVRYEYDPDQRLSKVFDPKNNLIFQAGFDDYNRAGTQTLGGSAHYSTDFSLKDRLSVVTDPNHVVTNQIYDADYRPVQVSDSTGRQVDITYTNDFGPATVTDPKNFTTEYRYDAAGNVKYSKDSQGNETRYLYDVDNNLICTRDARGADVVNIYDAQNRVIKVLHHAIMEVDVNGEFTGTYSYDPNNVTLYDYDPVTGNLLSTTDPEGNIISHTYDANGLPLTTLHPSGYQEEKVYDNRFRVATTRNLGGEYTQFQYDHADRVVSTTTAAGSVTQEYDANGNVIKKTDGRLHSTFYEYDANNNLQKVTDPEGGITHYSYDTVNNLLTRITLPNGAIKEIDYDELNRPVEVRYRVTVPTASPVITTETLDVGVTNIGGSSAQQLMVCNNGNASVEITQVTIDNANFTIDLPAPLSIAPGSCASLSFTFNGTAVGVETGTATITFADNSTIQIGLTGQVEAETLGASAVSVLDGIKLTWNPYPGQGVFDHYNIYRSQEMILDISGLTPIAVFNTVTSKDYLDAGPEYGKEYYYCVVAFDPVSNILTKIESVGPVAKLNLGKIEGVIDAASTAQDEKSVRTVFNPVVNEYLMVYEKDASGTGSNWDIYAQRVSETGVKIGGPISVLATGYTERNPRVAYNDINNDYLVVFEYDSNGAGHYLVAAQRLSAAGVKIGGAYLIYNSASPQYFPCIAYNSFNNEYLVAFENDISGDGKLDIVRFLLNASGVPVSGKYNTLTGYHFQKPKLAFNEQHNEYLAVFELVSGTTISYIYGLRLDPAGAPVTGTGYIAIGSTVKKSIYPEVIYNPDRDEYAVAWQYDSDGLGSAYGIFIRKVSWDGTAGANTYYSSTGGSLVRPVLSYFNYQDEYLLSLSILIGGTESNVMGQRISASDLSLLTTLMIGIAKESGKIEQNSHIAFNDTLNEYMVAYEYHNGLDWDLRAQRVGNYVKNLAVTPESLNFGDSATSQTVNVTEISGKSYMVLTNSVDQAWLSFPSTVIVTNANPSIDLAADVDRNGLPVGIYNGNIRIEFEGIATIVPVTMEVSNIAPNVPSNPVPADGATGQANIGTPLKVTMRWECSDSNPGDALSYDVYFGQAQALVANGDLSVKVSSNQTETLYLSPVLEHGTIYYWKIVAKDSHGESVSGVVWSFTTTAP